MKDIVYFDSKSQPAIKVATIDEKVVTTQKGQSVLAELILNVSNIMTCGQELAALAEANRPYWLRNLQRLDK